MRKFVAIPAITLATLSGSAFAEGLHDQFWGELSYFYPTINSTARLDATATARPGSSITLEDELDLADRKGTPYFSLGMRIGQNWRIEFEYYKLDRSSSKTLTRNIDWGDSTYPVGVQVDSSFDTTVYRLTGGYSFYKTPVAEVGGALGLHVTDFKTALSGQASGPGGTTTFQREANDALVPLPTLGLYGAYAFTDQFQVRGRVDYLTLKYDQYDGSLVNFLVAFDWRFSKNWGVGAGYRYVDYKLSADDPDFRGEVNYKFKGPTLFLTAGF